MHTKVIFCPKKIFAHVAKIFDVCRSLSRVAGWLQVATHKRNRYKKVQSAPTVNNALGRYSFYSLKSNVALLTSQTGLD